jgi:hypothetical protein
VRFGTVVDESTREPLATAAACWFTADDMTVQLDKIVAERGRQARASADRRICGSTTGRDLTRGSDIIGGRRRTHPGIRRRAEVRT